MPPPVPVDSTTGAGNSPARPKFSATAVVNGNTVEEPTIVIWLRDWAFAAPASATVATAARRSVFRIPGSLQKSVVSRSPAGRCAQVLAPGSGDQIGRAHV